MNTKSRVVSTAFSQMFMQITPVSAIADFFKVLPPDTKIVGIREDTTRLVMRVFFESKEFPVCLEGQIPPEIEPLYTKDEAGVVTVTVKYPTAATPTGNFMDDLKGL